MCRFVVMNLPNLGGLPNLSPPFTPESMTEMAKVSHPLYLLALLAFMLVKSTEAAESQSAAR